MSFVTPPVFVAGATLAADDLNILGDNETYLDTERDATRFAGVALVRTTNLSVNDSTWTDVSWVSASVDSDAFWASGTDIIIPASALPAGYSSIIVEVNITCRFAANGTGSRAIQVLLGGGTVEHAEYASAITGETTTIQQTVWAAGVVPTDVIKMAVYQTSGGALVANSLRLHLKRIGVA